MEDAREVISDATRDAIMRARTPTRSGVLHSSEDIARRASELAQSDSARHEIRRLGQELSEMAPNIAGVPNAFARWVRAELRYRRETPGIEVLAGPIATLQAGGGDCDDLAITWSALVQSVGVPAYPALYWVAGAWRHMVGVVELEGGGRRGLVVYELSDERFYGSKRAPLTHNRGRVLWWDPRARQFRSYEQ